MVLGQGSAAPKCALACWCPRGICLLGCQGVPEVTEQHALRVVDRHGAPNVPPEVW
jgi:hypothetical protein